MSDLTPYLGLTRPELDDVIVESVLKLRDALDAIDAWAQANAGGGGGGGGATALAQLTDVRILTVNDGQLLAWNGADSRWEPFDLPPVGLALSDLSDVDLTGLANGVILHWNGTHWVPAGAPPYTLGELGDVLDDPTADGQVLTWNASTGQWEARAVAPPPPPAPSMEQLTDTALTPHTDGDLMQWSSTAGKWVKRQPYELGFENPPIVFGGSPGNQNVFVGSPGVFLVSYDSMNPNNHVVLPAAAGAHDASTLQSGQLTVKRLDATHDVVIDAQPGETVDGAASYTLTAQYESVTVVSDGANWWVI